MTNKSLLIDTPVHIIQKYRAQLIAAGIPVERIILFGSYAKGTAKPWSDADLCVVSSIFGKDRYAERVSLAKLTSGVEDMIEPYPYHPDELMDPFDPLAQEIRMYGKLIV